MSQLRVTSAREADVRALEHLVRDAFAPFVERTGVRPAPLGTDWSTAISACGVRVALRHDHVVGVLVAWPHPDHLLIETLAVAPAEQRSGIGALLVDVAEREALETGTNEVRLSTDARMTENLDWYPRLGYRVAWRGTQQGFDRVGFVKRLDPDR